jgi:glutamine amidotransferase-like uncharacterized protein
VSITDPGHTHTNTATGQYIGINAGPIQYFGGPQSLEFISVAINSNVTGVTATFAGAAQGGTSTAFSIVQPTLILNKIIKVH